MKRRAAPKKTSVKKNVAPEIVASLKEAIAWAGGEDIPVRVTTVHVPTVDVRALRRNVGLSQSEFAANSDSRRPQ